MKRIIHIARNELYSLFYSPIAWLLLILFLLLTSVGYMTIASYGIEESQRGSLTEHLTDWLTVRRPFPGFLPDVLKDLYMIFPLITMGLISREKSSGTIKLLLSSPVRIREIVLGKFLAISTFTLCLLLMLGFSYIDMIICLPHADYGGILGTFIGLFIVLSAYAAIGLFISSLTSYQIVAAIITFAILFLLSQSGSLFQDIEFLRNIMYYLNMPKKSINLVQGLLNLRDVCYFLNLTACFLAFTIIRIRSGMQFISRWKKFSRYVVVVAIAFAIGMITKNPYINTYFDTTRYEIHTITPHTQSLMAKLNDGDLEITGYANLFDNHYKEWTLAGRNAIIDDVWEPYIRFKPNIKFNFVYYYGLDTTDYHFKVNKGKTLKQVAAKEAEAYNTTLDQFLSPEEVGKLVDIKAQGYSSFFIMKYKGKTTILRTYGDNPPWPEESHIAAAVNQLIIPPARLAFLDDEIERGPFSQRTRDYRHIIHDVEARESLVNLGFESDTISLHQKDIPDSLDAFVIADPRTPIAPESLEKVRKYIDAGGNLFLLTEPDRKEITKPLLDMLGLSIRDGLLIQSSDQFSSDVAFPYSTDAGTNTAPQLVTLYKKIHQFLKDKPMQIAFGGASVLEYKETNGFKVEPLMKTDPALCWNRVATIINDSLQMPVVTLPTDQKDSFTTAVRLTRTIHGRRQRILVTSDADWMTESTMFGYPPARFNQEYAVWNIGYFTYGEYPTNTLRHPSPDVKFRVSVDSIAPQKLILYWIIPILMVVISTVLLIRRKRK